MLEWWSIRFRPNFYFNLVGLAAVLVLTACTSQSNRVTPDLSFLPEPPPKEFQLTPEEAKQRAEELKRLHEIDKSTYRISAGDKFNVYVYGEEDLNTKEVLVKRDGTLTFKLVGDVAVAGKSIPEATNAIEQKLRRYIKYPKVSLMPYELKNSSFTIIGKVDKPGVYYFETDTRVAEAIALAGGLSIGIFQNNTVELADLEHSFVKRGDRILPINFMELIHSGNMTMNVPLADGDYIYIPSAMSKEVYVIGEVNAPGYFGYRENTSLGRILSYAGGMKNTSASTVYVLRGNLVSPKIFEVRIDHILQGLSRDFKMQPNDIVYVPKSPLGSWNAIVELVLPSMDAVLNTYLINDFARGGNR